MNEQTFTFPSSSGNGTYTARIASDGKLLCNCKGWTVRRPNAARHCKHTKQVAGSRPVVTRGEFTYLAEGGPDLVPPELDPAGGPTVGLNHRPMLATAMTTTMVGANFDQAFRDGWALEEKLDGHRLIVRVAGSGTRFCEVDAFARPQRDKPPLRRELPPKMVAQLTFLGDGEFDGELVAPSGKAWDVVVKGSHLIFVAFDILSLGHTECTGYPYELRRALLLERLGQLPNGQQSVSTVLSEQPTWKAVQAIWARGGEGAILKRLASSYQPGYRSPDWLKVKQVKQATLSIIGFEAGRNGPYSTIRLRGADGIETTVKTLGNRLLDDITKAPSAFLGREVVIEFQERTPAGEYRHGRFDHFKEQR